MGERGAIAVGGPPAPARDQVPFSFGAVPTGEGRTRFRLWAPGCRRLELELRNEGADAEGRLLEMTARGEGWFETSVAAGVGTRYRYRIDGELRVPDPAARAMDGDVHGWSVVVDPGAFVWAPSDWTGRPFEEAVIYEAHAGLFGGFKGLAAAVPGLVDLGVTTLELMPISDFPGSRNWGYDGVLPYAPDASYGTPEDLKSLVETCHAAGLMIYLDVVYNHFGPDGNFLPAYAPQFFSEDKQTLWGGAINTKAAPVRRFFIENAIFWINEYRFDGLRFDAVHALGDEDFLKDLAREVRAAAPAGRHVHLVLENDDNGASLLDAGFDAQWNDDFHHVLHVLLTGETSGYYKDFADRPIERLARALSEGFVYQGDPSSLRDGAPRGEPSAALRATAFVNFLQNHDQIGNRALGERLTVLAAPEALEAALVLLLLEPAPPLIFMGEEDGSKTPFLYFTDHEPELAKAVREGRRKEFAHFAAFADPKAREAIPDPNAPETFESSRPRPGSSARRTLVKTLLGLRASLLAPRLKGARSEGARVLSDRALEARWRLGDGSRLLIAVNFGAEDAPFDAPDGFSEIFASGPPARAGLGALSAQAFFAPPTDGR